MPRRLVLLVYLLHFLVTADAYALVPLVPTFKHTLGLSVVETGLLVGAPALAMMLLSLPVGLGTDRLGPRPLAIAAAVLLTVSASGQAVAGSYVVLVAAWLLFGGAYAVVYTAGPALLAAASDSRRSVLAGIGIAAGLGVVVGPASAGLLAEHLGLAAPFLVVAGCGALVTVGLLLQAPPAFSAPRHRLSSGIALAVADRYGAIAIGTMCFLGWVGGTTNLLVPLAFHRSGLGSGAIGIAFTAASILFVLGSVAVTRRGDRLPALAATGTAMVGLGAILAIAASSQSRAALLGFLLLRAPVWSVVSTLTYPLCVIGAARARIGAGIVLAVGNTLWGVGTFAGPLVGGAVAAAVGDGPVFAMLAAVGAVAGLAILGVRRAYHPASVEGTA